MTVTTDSRIDGAELQRRLTAVDPAALLVSPRLLRRVIKQDRGIPGIGLQVPHRKSYVIGRDALLAIADRDELGLQPNASLPDEVILLGERRQWLESLSREEILTRFWRMLFHARIDRHFARLRREGRLSDATIRGYVRRVGAVEFEEACAVLKQEDFLLPPGDLAECFSEFAALFLEIGAFSPSLRERHFPAIEEPERIDALLAELIDHAALLTATRPEGAPDLAEHQAEAVEEEIEAGPPQPESPSPEKCKSLLARADRVAVRGNVVRAAILRTMAANVAPPRLLETAHHGARADIDRLVNRLQSALELHDREAEEWRATLPALLASAAGGLWPQSARLLYDLQKVCVDFERDLYALDLVEWCVTWFRRPIKRPVPLQADVLLVKHLRAALKRVGKVRVSDEARRRLGILLRAAVHQCEERLRERIRPILNEALDSVGFLPANYPEQVARRKLIEELLDRVTERGFLTMGDLRDAISRNQLKMPDLRNPLEPLLGDQLIRLNRTLAETMDGVYHRGEIYLRWLQRFSSVFFGNKIGRWLTLFLILPFGGSFATLVFAQEMVHVGDAVARLVSGAPALKQHEVLTLTAGALAAPGGGAPLVGPPSVALMPEPHGEWLTSPWTVLVFGVFLFLLMHAPPFRRQVWKGVKACARGLYTVLLKWPRMLLNLPAVRRALDSGPVVFLRRFLLKPLLMAGLVAWVFHGQGAGGTVVLAASGVAFAVTLLLLASKLGQIAEEAATDWVARQWYWLHANFLPGLLRLTLDTFKVFLDGLERVIYTVDEWLRFRPGDSKWGLAFKPVLGLIWFLLTYLVRVVINLFVEPTVNPIKHFPAVTVGAKLILPLFPVWVPAITAFLTPFVGVAAAGTVATSIFILFPGLFGFAAWEFMENWKLYRANRSPNLKPVRIGSHGEKMWHFMRPGFHSGTLPRVYAKLRKAERRRNARAIHKQQEALHHARESISHFLEREFLFLLEESKGWGGARVHVGVMRVATNRVRVELCCPDLDDDGVWLAFEERDGWLTAEVTQAGWLERASDGQRAVFRVALAGLYKLAGVAVVREQVVSCLPAGDHVWDIRGEGLVLWPNGDFERSYVYDLNPPSDGLSPTDARPVLPASKLDFRQVPVTWHGWVEAWQGDQAGKPLTPVLPLDVRLLPASCAENAARPAALPVG